VDYTLSIGMNATWKTTVICCWKRL